MAYRYEFGVPGQFGLRIYQSDKTPDEIKAVHPKARMIDRITLDDNGKAVAREPYTNRMNPANQKPEKVEEEVPPVTTTTTTTPAPSRKKAE